MVVRVCCWLLHRVYLSPAGCHFQRRRYVTGITIPGLQFQNLKRLAVIGSSFCTTLFAANSGDGFDSCRADRRQQGSCAADGGKR